MTGKLEDKHRGDFGYGWRVDDNIRPLAESVEFYEKKIKDEDTPLDDKKVFDIALDKAIKDLYYWKKEKEWCQKPKNKGVAYSLKD